MPNYIREVLFERYSEELECCPQTATDVALVDALSGLDEQRFDAIINAVVDAMNEQTKAAYLAGFSAGANTCRLTYAMAV